MRLPSVSRFHFIECGANTGMEWGNVAVPTCQYTHGMLSCSEFTGVPLRTLQQHWSDQQPQRLFVVQRVNHCWNRFDTDTANAVVGTTLIELEAQPQDSHDDLA